MKKLILTFALAALALFPAFCQVSLVDGSLEALRSQTRVNMTVEFCFGTILGMDEELYSGEEYQWRKVKPVIIQNFIDNVEAETGSAIHFGVYPDAPLTLFVSVLSLGEEGDYDCETQLLDADGKALATMEGPGCDAGKPGPVLALFKEGATRNGKALGAFIREALTGSE